MKKISRNKSNIVPYSFIAVQLLCLIPAAYGAALSSAEEMPLFWFRSFPPITKQSAKPEPLLKGPWKLTSDSTSTQAPKINVQAPKNKALKPKSKALAPQTKEVFLSPKNNEMDIITQKNTRPSPKTRPSTEDYLQTQAKDWLSQYATGKIESELGSGLVPKSSKLDLLVPLFFEEEGKNTSTWFIQPGAISNSKEHNKGRDIAHAGVGYRNKDARSFLGFNAFYDYDLTRSHHRGSLGLEYARQYFKISSNYYFPLTKWKKSTDKFTLFGNDALLEEKTAYGADLYFSGYLPELPWVSLEAKYHIAWSDNKIGLSNDNNPVRNPYTLSSTLNFQPIPLFTLKAGYAQELDGEKGMLLSAGITYRFGIPLSKQMDQSQILAVKTLDIQLLEFVQRENNIQLEYTQLPKPVQAND